MKYIQAFSQNLDCTVLINPIERSYESRFALCARSCESATVTRGDMAFFLNLT